MRISLSLRVFLVYFGVFVAFTHCRELNAESQPNLKHPSQQSTPASFVPAGPLLIDSSVLVEKETLLKAVNFSLEYLETEDAVNRYKAFSAQGITRERIKLSLERFIQVLEGSQNPQELQTTLSEEFELLRPTDSPNPTAVKFTGYFQPIYKASRTRSKKYQFPLYRLPPTFDSWQKPHPSRVQLEGLHGTGNPNSPVVGKELAWLASRYEAFMVHVQGSAILQLDDGSQMAVGFAGATDHKFHGVNKNFLKANHVSWNELPTFFRLHPEKLDEVISKDDRFIFFKENPHPMPIGSLGFPVLPERSIATDKSKLPPGALSVLRTSIPYIDPKGNIQLRPGIRFVLDQDTGSAIKGAARVDIFMGTGPEAQKKANAVLSFGDLYYLVLRDPRSNGGK